MEIGSYRGLNMSLSFNGFRVDLILKGAMTHQAELGTDARGNLTRIDHALEDVPDRLKSVQAQLDNLYQRQARAERPSVLDKLKSSSPPVRTMLDKGHKKEMEVR